MEASNILDNFRLQTLETAIKNVLGTEIAERTYAQILDGLPTERALRDIFPYPIADHPVLLNHHVDICEGFQAKAYDFISRFNVSSLRF